MKKFDHSDGRGFGKKGFDGRNRGSSFGRDSFSAKKEMHQAICSDCGESCEVPFRPSGSKPVFCNNCFRGHKQAPVHDTRGSHNFVSTSRSFKERAPRSSFSDAPKNNNLEDKLNALHIKLDKIIALLNDNPAPKDVDKKTKTQAKEKAVKKEELVKKDEKKSKKVAPKPKKAEKKVAKKASKK